MLEGGVEKYSKLMTAYLRGKETSGDNPPPHHQTSKLALRFYKKTKNQFITQNQTF